MRRETWRYLWRSNGSTARSAECWDQDWSLRVTLVFQHEETEWQLVHRHADPLVHAISMEHMAALARGHS